MVLIASAASGMPSGERRLASSGMARSIRSMLRGVPMTPVDATRTSSDLILSSLATNSASRRALYRPSLPVHAFAFPELAMMALTFPSLRFSRHTITGAAFTLLVVKTPAAVASFSEKIRAMSNPPSFLIPAATADALKPGILNSSIPNSL